MIPHPLANGFCFGEGPRWFEGLLWFSDMLGEAVHTSTMGGSLTTLPLPGHSPSGLGFRPDGSLLIVDWGKRPPGKAPTGETLTTPFYVVTYDFVLAKRAEALAAAE